MRFNLSISRYNNLSFAAIMRELLKRVSHNLWLIVNGALQMFNEFYRADWPTICVQLEHL